MKHLLCVYVIAQYLIGVNGDSLLLGQVFEVATGDLGTQHAHRVNYNLCLLPEGRWMSTWRTLPSAPTTGLGAYGRVMNEDGTPYTDTVTIAEPEYLDPACVYCGGSILASWNGNGFGTISAALFSLQGVKTSSTTVIYDRHLSSIATSIGSDAVIIFCDNDLHKVFLYRVSCNGSVKVVNSSSITLPDNTIGFIDSASSDTIDTFYIMMRRWINSPSHPPDENVKITVGLSLDVISEEVLPLSRKYDDGFVFLPRGGSVLLKTVTPSNDISLQLYDESYSTLGQPVTINGTGPTDYQRDIKAISRVINGTEQVIVTWTRLSTVSRQIVGMFVEVVRTSVPTAIPTSLPTTVPTAVPTAVPTSVPTTVPTVVPTAVPTFVPTAVPTSIPTVVPTSVPTVVPTSDPTAVPTYVPTVIPTSLPTVAPTAVPTSVPTSAPTVTDDTLSPSLVPTGIPTAVPTSVSPSRFTGVPTPPTPTPPTPPTPQPNESHPCERCSFQEHTVCIPSSNRSEGWYCGCSKGYFCTDCETPLCVEEGDSAASGNNNNESILIIIICSLGGLLLLLLSLLMLFWCCRKPKKEPELEPLEELVHFDEALQ
eukprot:TRINITY_DN5201_c0_g1_i1.p1 TRINITY_DN5201_c0_g1~~TRINITY_DN5201_c0_g1_i1.p1  ORF type:complete len:595 (+),score=136.31 TRINITY_DN5201_c0_g1_i1:120-1904(+)